MTTRNEELRPFKVEAPWDANDLEMGRWPASIEMQKFARDDKGQTLLVESRTYLLQDKERESSLGRDAEGHLTMTLGPGAESPSRKGKQT